MTEASVQQENERTDTPRLVDSVAGHADLVSDKAAEGRARREVCDEVVQALKDAGFIRKSK